MMTKNSENDKEKYKRVSRIEHHKKQGKSFIPPLAALPKLKPTSWINEALPDVLWMAILLASFERKYALSLLFKVLTRLREYRLEYPDLLLVHSSLSKSSDKDVNKIFADILVIEKVKEKLRALRLIESLPDRSFWELVGSPRDGL